LTTALYQTYLRRTGGIQSESLGVDRVNVGVRDAVVSHRDPLEDWLHHFPLGFCCKFLEGPGKSADDLERLDWRHARGRGGEVRSPLILVNLVQRTDAELMLAQAVSAHLEDALAA